MRPRRPWLCLPLLLVLRRPLRHRRPLPPLGHLESPPAGKALGALQQAPGCPRRSGVETLR
eukprot:11445782-Heterocapsa_arctica.AAC.1